GIMPPRGSRQVPTIGKQLGQTLPKAGAPAATQPAAGFGKTAGAAQGADKLDFDTANLNSLLPNRQDGSKTHTTPTPVQKTQKTFPTRKRGALPFVLVGVAFVAVLGGIAALLFIPWKSFKLVAPAALTLAPGQKLTVPIEVERRNLTEPIDLT